MADYSTLLYEVTGRVARITLNRPERGNGITFAMPRELAACVERANLDPAVHVILLAGTGKGFCGGYDLVASAEALGADQSPRDGGAGASVRMTELSGVPAGGLGDAVAGSAIDPAVVAANHDPSKPWDPAVDWQMMSRN